MRPSSAPHGSRTTAGPRIPRSTWAFVPRSVSAGRRKPPRPPRDVRQRPGDHPGVIGKEAEKSARAVAGVLRKHGYLRPKPDGSVAPSVMLLRRRKSQIYDRNSGGNIHRLNSAGRTMRFRRVTLQDSALALPPLTHRACVPTPLRQKRPRVRQSPCAPASLQYSVPCHQTCQHYRSERLAKADTRQHGSDHSVQRTLRALSRNYQSHQGTHLAE
jgi:hypothetical protein